MAGELWRLNRCQVSNQRGLWADRELTDQTIGSRPFYLIPNSIVVMIECVYNPEISFFEHYKILSNKGVGYVSELSWRRRFEPLIAKESTE